MIWFSNPGGRTGNQLFQYAFLENIRRSGELVLTTKLRPFLSQFHTRPGYHSLEARLLVRLVDRVINPLIYLLLVKTRVVSSWSDRHFVLRFRKGLFARLVYVEGYFQDADSWKAGQDFRYLLKPKAWEEAAGLLSRVPRDQVPVFLHVRRGDYLGWTILGKPDPSLPVQYYQKAVAQIRERCKNAFFVIATDDPVYVRESFGWLGGYLVSDASVQGDLALMASCAWGILSNSSLAWWGGNLMGHRETVVAPEYWLGFKSAAEYPPGILPPWAESLPYREWSLSSE